MNQIKVEKEDIDASSSAGCYCLLSILALLMPHLPGGQKTRILDIVMKTKGNSDVQRSIFHLLELFLSQSTPAEQKNPQWQKDKEKIKTYVKKALTDENTDIRRLALVLLATLIPYLDGMERQEMQNLALEQLGDLSKHKYNPFYEPNLVGFDEIDSLVQESSGAAPNTHALDVLTLFMPTFTLPEKERIWCWGMGQLNSQNKNVRNCTLRVLKIWAQSFSNDERREWAMDVVIETNDYYSRKDLFNIQTPDGVRIIAGLLIAFPILKGCIQNLNDAQRDHLQKCTIMTLEEFNRELYLPSAQLLSALVLRLTPTQRNPTHQWAIILKE